MTAPVLSFFRLWADKMARANKRRKKTRQQKLDQRLIAIAGRYPSKNNDIKRAKRLLKKGANPNAQQGLALRKATGTGRRLFVELLLNVGACPDFIDSAMLASLRCRNERTLLALILSAQKASHAGKTPKAKVLAFPRRPENSTPHPASSHTQNCC